ncbi:MAG: hypothetical protein A3H57_03250 [Candidatus Taylorbacteria bacterium RIFCSPLOWO2_02_FULL_43_11]|uniref:histidine kinase n=1 Tax=Candidatus Taylorbacteria bacterium RIFCSPHIGHO2_02_FULL_43_32b TaxID=1802306 RepID=A0A1G2MFL6_9BACT|nr:MAG: hypothetical protein A2743_00830 [Candidatus Taylorbacteria bacterium RIFCSPHIGHO2_01_FULL_43_47]OHA22667.1 MAG: hypothetical protein A3C72_01255 [Candidatus Taylorbacteria bacterium RIFCSPHIGHO2_02_FULL_43_32b]OHA29627.1 MAG: hypothetical protein A3B08_03360 [Candidatus Taylorbacteria bacterium RIFCSPLOWO2_01_FULL_43_44]OHA36122.1 MAG: hypothetical protein A3H57_03250 [Candidatus Taylorbacteria bacterium RIFCSPLOWO2_02_FULL_43_11]
MNSEGIIKKDILDSALLLDYVTEAIVVSDSETRVLYANAATKKLLGFENLNHVKLFDLVHPEDKNKVKEYYQTLKKTTSLISIRRMKKKSGEYAIIERNARILDDGSTISILRDVTERFNFEQRKDTFISVASHELKNPLNNISLYSEIAQNYIAEGNIPKARYALKKILPQIEKMSNLISDLLDLAKIQAGKLEYRMKLFSLDETVREVADEVIVFSKKKFHIDIRGKILNPVYGDKDKISQVLQNLLANSIKYSPSQNTIIVNVSENAETASVSVKDFGIGIKKEEQNKIFEKFYQAPSSSRYASGMGIGLFLCREIIKKHGGRLFVESEYGAGSTFTFVLPLGKVAS